MYELLIAHPSVKELDYGLILINCPRCGEQNAQATCVDQQECIYFVIRHTTTWVTCHACNSKLFAKALCRDLIDFSPDELESLVVWRVSLIRRFLVLASLAICILPLLGTIMSLIAIGASRQIGGKWKRLSYVALGISFVPLLFFVAAELLLR